MGFFDKLSELGKSFRKSSGGSVLGIDIGSSAIKVVEIKDKGGKAVLETYGEISTGPYGGLEIGQVADLSVDKTIEAMRDLFREANVTAKAAAISIPMRSSLLKVIHMPIIKDVDLNRMVPIEARKHIPVPISEVTLDWWPIPDREMSDESSGSMAQNQTKDVLLVAIHKSTVKKYQDIADKFGIESKNFEIETFSVMRSVLGRDISAVAVIDIGASTTKVSIIDYGVVRTTHIINRGSQDVTLAIYKSKGISFTDAEKLKRSVGLALDSGNTSPTSSVVDYLFYETGRVLADYTKEYSRLISKVVLTGGGSLPKGVKELAEAKLNKKSFGQTHLRSSRPLRSSRIS